MSDENLNISYDAKMFARANEVLRAEIDRLRAENERLRAERTALSNEVLDIVNSRPTSLNDDLYDWAYDAEEKLRRLIEENKGGER